MKIEKFVCDFCKKDLQEDELFSIGVFLTRLELCENCFNKTQILYKEYNDKCKLLEKDFFNKIEKLKKENL